MYVEFLGTSIWGLKKKKSLPCYFLLTPKEKLIRTRGKLMKVYLQKHLPELKIKEKGRQTKEKLQN